MKAKLISVLAFLASAPFAVASESTFDEFSVPASAMEAIRQEWVDQLLATRPLETWAPMRVDLTDSMLARLGLPSKELLLSQRFPVPTMVGRDGTMRPVQLPSVSTFEGVPAASSSTSLAGSGCFGIRPGAWLLLRSGGGLGWCSLAHVYGSPGSYQISTAGHCGEVGQTATVIAAIGTDGGTVQPVLLDFGRFVKSSDGGPGSDWALISVDPAYQELVSPTMCFWGGPLGMYTAVGAVVDVTMPRRGLVPEVTVTPNPLLAQAIVHYGHGSGVGSGGTPRVGFDEYWAPDYFIFVGAISPGDSGSGANTAAGDTLGAHREAAGIMTHLWVDPMLRQGVGIMLGTRATVVPATLANGQLVPYPTPMPGAP